MIDVQDQVALALGAYSEISNHAAWFHIDGAVNLKLTPDKPNTARSESTVRFGKEAVKLFIIAFMPGDGTGDESAHKLDRLRSTLPTPTQQVWYRATNLPQNTNCTLPSRPSAQIELPGRLQVA